MSQTQNEIKRIANVYRNYQENNKVQASWSIENLGNQLLLGERKDKLYYIISKFGYIPLKEFKILEVGCGTGNNLQQLYDWGANPNNLFGVDILKDRINQAKTKLPEYNFFHMNAEELTFDNEFFELILVFTVFSSILEKQMLANVSSEINRVLKKNGAIAWYDFRYNNPKNINVRGVSLKQIKDYFGNYECHIQSMTVFPTLVRKLGRLTPFVYPLLNTFPVLRTHYLGLLIKR